MVFSLNQANLGLKRGSKVFFHAVLLLTEISEISILFSPFSVFSIFAEIIFKVKNMDSGVPYLFFLLCLLFCFTLFFLTRIYFIFAALISKLQQKD
jgi:hypothetical protein